jgi:hypothetical protein
LEVYSCASELRPLSLCCPALEKVSISEDIDGESSVDDIVAFLASCRGLSEISLRGYFQEEVFLAIANNFPQLKRLELLHCLSISSVGWEAVCRECKELCEVKFDKSEVTLSMLASIGEHGKRWRYLRLRLPYNITSCSISELFQPRTCYLLRKLTVYGITLPEELMLAVGQSCPLLTRLTLSLWDHKPPANTASESLARGCPHLQVVDITSSNWELPLGWLDALVLSLGEHCQRITELRLSVNSVSEAGLEEISMHMKRLRRLELLGYFLSSSPYSNASVRSLLERLPCLQLLQFQYCSLVGLKRINRYVHLCM